MSLCDFCTLRQMITSLYNYSENCSCARHFVGSQWMFCLMHLLFVFSYIGHLTKWLWGKREAKTIDVGSFFHFLILLEVHKAIYFQNYFSSASEEFQVLADNNQTWSVNKFGFSDQAKKSRETPHIKKLCVSAKVFRSCYKEIHQRIEEKRLPWMPNKQAFILHFALALDTDSKTSVWLSFI